MKLFRKSIMFLIILATSLCCFVLGTNEVRAAGEREVTLDFTAISDFSDWKSYAKHEVVYTEGNVTFTSAVKQSSNITDCPVTKGQPVSFDLTLEGYVIKSFTFECKQWTTKAQTITGHYSLDHGNSYTALSTTSSEFTFSSGDLSTYANNIKITFSDASNQIGITSLTLVLVEGEVTSLPQLSSPVVSVDGKVASWNAIEGAIGYNVGLFESVEATTAKYEQTITETSYDFTNFRTAGDWYVKAQAVGDNTSASSSDYSSSESAVINNPTTFECTLTDFLKAIDPDKSVTFVVKGTLKAFYIDNAESEENSYIETYNNASFYLTDGTNSVICYRVSGEEGAKLKVGDIVTVSGKLGSYNNVNQIATGGSYVEIIPGAALEFETLETKTSLKLTIEDEAVSSVAIRFGMMLTVEQYNALVAAGGTFGVAVVKMNTLGSTELSSVVDQYAFACASVVRVNESGVADEEGAYYQFSFVVNNVPEDAYAEVLVAACYVLIDGIYYVAAEATHSVQSVAKVYVSAEDTSSYTKYLDILNEIATE